MSTIAPADILFAGLLIGTCFGALDRMLACPAAGAVRARDLTLLLGLAPADARRIFDAWRADRGHAERFAVRTVAIPFAA